MSKQLPYFKFIVSEWLTGDILFEDYELQGIFINACAIYWHKEAKLTITELQKRIKSERLMELTDRFIVVKNNFISIAFLNEQFKERSHISQTNSSNGLLGGRPKGSKNKKVTQKANGLFLESESKSETKAKKTNIEIEEEEELFDLFWEKYNYKIGLKKAKMVWDKLLVSEQIKCISIIPSYVQSTPEKKYRKHPATYLNGKHWEDELNVTPPPKKQGFEYPPLPSPPVDFTLGY